jgi:hypothetical protein
MARSSRPAPAVGVQGSGTGEPAQPGGWRRADVVALVLSATAVVLIAVQFALAGFGAFTMDKTPTDNSYGAHALVGLVIAALTLFILAAVLSSRAARAQARTRWLAVALAVLSVVVQPVLGQAGTNVPALGALHALNGLAILAVAGRLTWETARRRAASQST